MPGSQPTNVGQERTCQNQFQQAATFRRHISLHPMWLPLDVRSNPAPAPASALLTARGTRSPAATAPRTRTQTGVRRWSATSSQRPWSRLNAAADELDLGSGSKRSGASERAHALASAKQSSPAQQLAKPRGPARDREASYCQWPSVSPHWWPQNSPLVAIISPRWWPSFLPMGGHHFSPPGSRGLGQGLHPLAGGRLCEPVAVLVLGDDHVGVMQEPVDGRGRHGLGH